MWFSYNPIDQDFVLHKSENAAREEAEGLLQLERDNASEGWSEEVDSICWGEVKNIAQISKLREIPKGIVVDEDTGLGSDGHDYSDIPEAYRNDGIMDYALMPPKEATP